MASPLPRRIVRAVHESAWRVPAPKLGAEVGADAGRVSPIRERPGDLLRLSQPLSSTGLDELDARPGRVAGITVVSGCDFASTDRGHAHGNHVAGRLWPCLRPGALH